MDAFDNTYVVAVPVAVAGPPKSLCNAHDVVAVSYVYPIQFETPRHVS